MAFYTGFTVIHNKHVYSGLYRQDCVKFKDISRTSKIFSYCFQGLNTDLHVKIQFSEMLESITKDIS